MTNMITNKHRQNKVNGTIKHQSASNDIETLFYFKKSVPRCVTEY